MQAVLAGYGIYAFVKRGFADYLFMKSVFVFFDFSEPVIFFLVDYAAVMILFALIGYYIIHSKPARRMQTSAK